MLTCITCSKQRVEDGEEAPRGTPNTKDAVKTLTNQVSLLSLSSLPLSLSVSTAICIYVYVCVGSIYCVCGGACKFRGGVFFCCCCWCQSVYFLLQHKMKKKKSSCVLLSDMQRVGPTLLLPRGPPEGM